MEDLQSQILMSNIMEAYNTGQSYDFKSPLGTKSYSISPFACGQILDVYLQLPEYGRYKLLSRYSQNPAGLAVFCSRLAQNFGSPSEWSNVFRTTLGTCVGSLLE